MGQLTRRDREKRAYTFGLVAAGSGAVGLVLFVVAVVSPLGIGPALIALVVAAIAGFMFRSTVRS